MVEDAAESIGSLYKGKHTGTFGKIGILSFNGNKTITTGGGGMLLFQDEKLGKLAKHLTTTAKIRHLLPPLPKSLHHHLQRQLRQKSLHHPFPQDWMYSLIPCPNHPRPNHPFPHLHARPEQ
ncbi:MAG: putative pyridoxal phosphate-dependent aminotransferase EpsN [Verrucomicrobia bacterium ADurb.Bin474]|nr:MAG: putative pyridoxal phosphate-dependent aminotransferase EpsN [Verrucomicrobia bacterium ADurb.Bin474]